jgi:hypothetical protein
MKLHFPLSFYSVALFGAGVGVGTLAWMIAPLEKPATASNIIEAVDSTAPRDRATHTPSAAGTQCGDISYNRSVDSIGVRHDPTGQMFVDVAYSLLVGDEAGADADLDAEVRMEILVDGVVILQASFPGQFDFIGNDAVTCATACASPCGSIFGNGTCTGCDCKYNRSGTFPLTAPLEPGHVVRVTIVPFPNAEPEIHTKDDVLEVTFGDPNPCCPADLNGDGVVDGGDLLIMLAEWGDCD